MAKRGWVQNLGIFVNKHTLLLLAGLLLGAHAAASATSIAVVRSESNIVVAADSRVVDVAGRMMPDICKIRHSGNWYYIVYGLAFAQGADVFQLADNALRNPKTARQAVQTLRESLTPVINTALSSNELVRSRATQQPSILGIVVVGRDKETLVMAHLKFRLASTGMETEAYLCPGDCEGGVAAVVAPSADAAKFNWDLDSDHAARDFVEFEISRRTIDIGPPLQMLRIRKDGQTEWLERPSPCVTGTK